MHVIFDVDGVLFDTRSSVRRAYELAGVDMPDEAWGLPWQSWLLDLFETKSEARDAHGRKNYFYRGMIERREIRKLPACDLIHALDRYDLATVGVLTGASSTSVTSLLTRHYLSAVPIIGGSKTQAGKIEMLKSLGTGVYIDDQEFPSVPGWRIVRHDGTVETMNDLMDKLWMR